MQPSVRYRSLRQPRLAQAIEERLEAFGLLHEEADEPIPEIGGTQFRIELKRACNVPPRFLHRIRRWEFLTLRISILCYPQIARQSQVRKKRLLISGEARMTEMAPLENTL